ncbi:hypothetical protein CPB84DRAFT_1761180 [Gymnopilus junonius]|uniref:Uncharacterized protein n=1 Tax=Gymnopilus junonius TaxID=109634 RepID=A0A9P5P1D9_GYMJU|nr:hypothetical protein CPB84DRAFT_1761180 [Gymnopilus junonius]
MLLKFTSPDMFNTSLINVATNQRAYDILTIPLPDGDSSLPKKLSTLSDPHSAERRQTILTDATGNIVANIIWNGRRPDITILDEKVGALTDLFGSSTYDSCQPKILAIPTRFDTEFIWTATPESLTLFDYDTETIKGTFYQNVVRISTRSKVPKSRLTSLSKSKHSSASPDFLHSTSSVSLWSSSSRSTEDQEPAAQLLKSIFISPRIPGLGSNYLEFASHPLAHDIEIILSFLMMEILRRGRFNLPPYVFGKPKLWQEARNSFIRRLRRNTI